MFARENHIPQPPHSTGAKYEGLRPFIRPQQVPSPTEIIENDALRWENAVYTTVSGLKPPLATSDFTALDQGNSSPKFLRLSTWNLPASSKLAYKCHIPIAGVCQPFAEQNQNEEPVPVVDFSAHGPPRCEKCRAYINPWCTWREGGNKWRCNLCSHATPVIPEYFCGIDANSLRLDFQQRPELTKGTVDFIVTPDYWSSHLPPRISEPYYSDTPRPTGPRKPEPLKYIFAFDVSVDSVQSGFLQSTCEALLTALFSSTPLLGPESRVCVITFDKTIHFYDLSSSHAEAPMLVVSDLEDVFIPLRDGIFVYPQQSGAVLQKLLESIPSRYQDGNACRESALGSALRACQAALHSSGGKVVVFQATLPTVGPGALSPDLPTSDFKESSPFKTRDIAWNNIAEECAQDAIGVSFFLGMSKPIDVGSIGIIASSTGGDIFFHAKFSPERNEAVMNSQLQRVFMRKTVYDCTARVRCSYGLRLSQYYGNFYPRSSTDIDFATMDADKSFSFSLEHTHTLSTREMAHVQVATLYTTVQGERRVRVCNTAVPVVELMGNVFQFADVGATINHIAREAFTRVKGQKLSQVKDHITDECAQILAAYKENCAPVGQRHAQLVIPEAFFSLPAYCLGLQKSKPLKAGNVSPDVRNYMLHRLNSSSTRFLVQNLYPRITALHDLEDDAALPNPETGHIYFPFSMRDTHLHMTPDGLYLGDNGESTVLWVGGSISPQILIDLFDKDDFLSLNPNLTSLPILSSRLSNQIRNIITHSQLVRGYWIRLQIARQNQDGAELEFSDMLVEDNNNGALSYPDYLALLFKRAEYIISGNSDPVSLRGTSTPW